MAAKESFVHLRIWFPMPIQLVLQSLCLDAMQNTDYRTARWGKGVNNERSKGDDALNTH